MIIAGRFEKGKELKNNEGDNDMFLNKQICPRCKNGKYTYELDSKSECCPYIGSWRPNKCHFYKPLKVRKTGVLCSFLNKRDAMNKNKISK